MNSRSRNQLVVLVLLLTLTAIDPPSAVAAAPSVKLRNIPASPHFAPTGTPLPDLAAALALAVTDEGWIVTSEARGVIRATLYIRSHEAIVNIGFDETNFWIDYQDSINLNYNPNGLKGTRTRRATEGPRIHRNYNVWVGQLAKRILIRMKIAPKADRSDTVVPLNPLLIAEEIEKLDGLRKRGVLSQREFDEHKAKLLAR